MSLKYSLGSHYCVRPITKEKSVGNDRDSRERFQNGIYAAAFAVIGVVIALFAIGLGWAFVYAYLYRGGARWFVAEDIVLCVITCIAGAVAIAFLAAARVFNRRATANSEPRETFRQRFVEGVGMARDLFGRLMGRRKQPELKSEPVGLEALERCDAR